jgi:hypothetical protein
MWGSALRCGGSSARPVQAAWEAPQAEGLAEGLPHRKPRIKSLAQAF